MGQNHVWGNTTNAVAVGGPVTTTPLNGDKRGLDVQFPGSLQSSFGELKSVQKTPIIELYSAVSDVSVLRNVVTTANSGAVSLVQSEFYVASAAQASSTARLASAERGRYLPGFQAQAGLGVRLPQGITYTEGMDAMWGYYNADDGFGFGRDHLGVYVFRRRSGVTLKTYQSDWNGDKMDGTGYSGSTLDLTNGNIFELNFTWYGYGAIDYVVISREPLGYPSQRPVRVHSEFVSQTTSIEQPNLPITVEVMNGAADTAHGIYVGGRQFSILGSYNPNFRATGEFRGTVALTTTFKPLISFRRKIEDKFQNHPTKLDRFEVKVTADTIVGFITNGTLTGASWQTPTAHSAAETICETDISATAITGGTVFGGKWLVTATGSGSNSVGFSSGGGFNFDFIETQPVTMVARTVTATGNASVSVLNIIEDW